MYVGKKIKQLRKMQKMTLKDLSDISGIQIATLSRMENFKMTGTLSSHMAIAKALGVDITHLYSDVMQEEEKLDVLSSESNTDVFVHSEKSSYEILTTNLMARRMLPTMVKIEPNGSTNKEHNKGGSEKFIFVLTGEIEIDVGGRKFQLKKRSTLHFDASKEHFMKNIGKTTAKIISVVTPVSL